MQALNDPDLLILCNNDYSLAMKCFQKFVIDISKGNNKVQKKDLFENLLKFLKLCHFPEENVEEEHSESPSQMGEITEPLSSKKRPQNEENEITTDVPEKKAKLDHGNEFQLPEEIWLKIMNYLKTQDLFQNFALLNKYFHGLSQDSRAVKSLLLKNINDKTKYQNAVKVIKRSKHMKNVHIQLSFAHWKQLMSYVLKSAKLKSLIITKQYPTGKGVNIRECDALKLRNLGDQLEHLEFQQIYMTPKGISEMVKITTLKVLNIYNYVECFPKENIIALAKNCKHLETLFLFNNFEKAFDGTFKEAFDTLFTERRNTLKKLTIIQIAKSVEEDLFEKIGLCHRLEGLTIRNAQLTESNLSNIAKLIGLKNLFIDDVSAGRNLDEMVYFIKALSTSKIKYLTFYDCGNLGNTFFQELSNKYFPVLERLYLDRSYYSKESIENLLNNSPILKSMQLYRGRLDMDIDKTFLSKMSEEDDVYIDFSDLNHGGNSNPIIQYTMEKYLSKTTKWTKYKNLFNDFYQWCKENDWWHDGPYPMPRHIFPKGITPWNDFCKEQRERIINIEGGNKTSKNISKL